MATLVPPSPVTSPPPPPTVPEKVDYMDLPCPIPYEEIHREALMSLKPELFEGMRFDFTKGLNQRFCLSHSVFMGPTEVPSQSPETIKIPTANYEFGANFLDPKLMLFGRLMTDGRVNARLKCDLSENLTMKANAQLTSEPHMSQGMFNFDYKGKDYRSQFQLGNGALYGANYIQSVTPNLSLGGEVFWTGQHRKSGIGYAARYNTDKMVATGQVASTGMVWKMTPPRKTSPIPESLVLHVDQLSRNVNENHLKEIFGNFGEVVHVRLAIDHNVNLPKGFGYVEFKNRADAEKALLYMDGAQVDGKVVRAKFTLPERKRPSSPRGAAGSSRRDGPRTDDIADPEKDGVKRLREDSPRRRPPHSPQRRSSPIARRGSPRRGPDSPPLPPPPPRRRGDSPVRRRPSPPRRGDSPPPRRRPSPRGGRSPSPPPRRLRSSPRGSPRRPRGSPIRRRSPPPPPPHRRRSPRRARSPPRRSPLGRRRSRSPIRRHLHSRSRSLSPRRRRGPPPRRGRSASSSSPSPSPRKGPRRVSRSRSPRRPVRGRSSSSNSSSSSSPPPPLPPPPPRKP